jgi:hypothetical protein
MMLSLNALIGYPKNQRPERGKRKKERLEN